MSRGSERPRVGPAIFITILWILDTIHVSINWAYLANAYIRHGETREAQITSQLESLDEFLPQSVANTVVTFINLLSADLITVCSWALLYSNPEFHRFGDAGYSTDEDGSSFSFPCHPLS